MTDATLPRSWRTCPRWVKWLVGVSLALNLIIISLGAGAAMRFHKHGGQHGGVATIGKIMHALPSERRDAARSLLKEAKPGLKPYRQARRAAQTNLAEVIAADPFDPAAATAAFENLRRQDDLTKTAAHGVMVEILSLLTAEERAEVSERLDRRRKDRD